MYVIVKYGSALEQKLFLGINSKHQHIWSTNIKKALKFSSMYLANIFMKNNDYLFQIAFDYQIELED